MAIIATNTGGSFERELLASGLYPARCYSMVHIGHVEEIINGEKKTMNKVRLTFELPTELRVFKEENGEQPMVFSKEFTLSMHEKSGLRSFLKNWRGKDFTEEEAKHFDVTKLLGVQGMVNIFHKVSKKGDTYAEIGTISPMPKGMECPPQINPTFELSYDNFNWEAFDKLPDFLKDKIRRSSEYMALNVNAIPQQGAPVPMVAASSQAPVELFNDGQEDDGLPF